MKKLVFKRKISNKLRGKKPRKKINFAKLK